ncbi:MULTISPECIES: Yip1 family protein [Clostridium]|uniref:Yip1 domain protein n=1 Tax=Clostridium ragsdalei P11 TaxID=1353534 RepID=A0A1A6B469_9CLOT|nr:MULTISPECIES: Yip1 family protein [Clostridium]OBR97139.1 Yip1 domain protein [Clostridium ragsdalei P11]QXE20904.1 YIP1 family protein [Clostridium sp. 001]
MSEENKDGILKNITGAIISPRKTMERVNKNPKVWRYLIPVTLVQLIVAIIELPKLTSYTILQAQEMPNFSQAAIPIMKTGITISTIIGALLTPALVTLISTVLIKVIASILKETGNFKNLYCVNILAYVPVLIAGILTGIIMLFTEPQNIKNISTSLTLVLSSSTDMKSTIYKLFSCINFFYIWSIVLSAIGTSVVCKMNMKKSAAIVAIIYILSVVVIVLV